MGQRLSGGILNDYHKERWISEEELKQIESGLNMLSFEGIKELPFLPEIERNPYYKKLIQNYLKEKRESILRHEKRLKDVVKQYGEIIEIAKRFGIETKFYEPELVWKEAMTVKAQWTKKLY